MDVQVILNGKIILGTWLHMLDMSVIKYKDQYESSRIKNRDLLRAKFEFLDNNITNASLDKMAKTWLRKDCECIKRLH